VSTPLSLERKLLAGADVIRAVSERDHTLEAVITSRVVDRDLDVIEPRGLDTTGYMENAVLLDHHRHDELPVGRALALDVTDDDVTALFEFASHPRARQIETLYAEKMLRAFSIGFLIKQTGPPVLKGARRTIERSELVEVSCVSVPSNRLALAKMLSIPDGASEHDLLAALGRIPTRKFFDLSQSYKEDYSMNPTELEKALTDAKAAEHAANERATAAEEKAKLSESRLVALERAHRVGDRGPLVTLDGEPFPFGGKSGGERVIPAPWPSASRRRTSPSRLSPTGILARCTWRGASAARPSGTARPRSR